MKLIIEPHKMRIVTESVQDVAYIKHIGYTKDDSNLYLKVDVDKLFSCVYEDDAVKESAEISIYWEDKNAGHKDSLPKEVVEKICVQHVEGPKNS